jgi:hypothetical protein
VDRFEALRRDALGLFALCDQDLTRGVPSCPGWSATDLRDHVLDTFRGEAATDRSSSACAIPAAASSRQASERVVYPSDHLRQNWIRSETPSIICARSVGAGQLDSVTASPSTPLCQQLLA